MVLSTEVDPLRFLRRRSQVVLTPVLRELPLRWCMVTVIVTRESLRFVSSRPKKTHMDSSTLKHCLAPHRLRDTTITAFFATIATTSLVPGSIPWRRRRPHRTPQLSRSIAKATTHKNLGAPDNTSKEF